MKPEDTLLDTLRGLIPHDEALLVGPGDDAAIVDRPAGPLAATTDLLVEGVDFFAGADPERLGRRAVAINLSDLAAVGASPEFFLLAIAFPPERGEAFALAVARGAIARGMEFGARLVGGDLSAAAQVVVAIALWGRPAGAALRRSGASPGDGLYVSGHPGEAAAGLRLAARSEAFAAGRSGDAPRFPELSAEHERRLFAAYHDPTPRVALGEALARERLASAAIDVSDGLGVDAGRIARASGVRCVVEEDRLPISSALVAFAEAEDVDPVALAIGGGDDYELLFTAPESAAERLAERSGASGVAVRRIGRVERGAGAVLETESGARDISELGHDHFERRP